MKQKDIFLKSEGDAWFSRNQKSISEKKLPDDDFILTEILEILPAYPDGIKVLEIGCGDGTRLAWLKNNANVECYGIDPSAQAVAVACDKGIHAVQGTADVLEFDTGSFDLVIFGFCLYLCDRDDLFKIASEANRVLRKPGWLLILDFYSDTPKIRNYHHTNGVQTYKMDYRKLFSWHPDFDCLTHKVRHHSSAAYTDDQNEWVGISVLRKMSKETLV